MITLNGEELDDGVDEPDLELLDQDDDDLPGESGCLFPKECCIAGPHWTSECFTLADAYRWEAGFRRQRAWERRRKREFRRARKRSGFSLEQAISRMVDGFLDGTRFRDVGGPPL